MLRKLRAALSIGAVWGLAHGIGGAVVGGLIGLAKGAVLSSALTFGFGGGLIGLTLGAGFGGLLSVMERQRTLDELTARRTGRVGFVVGTALGFAGVAVAAALTGMFGAAGGLGLPVAAQVIAIVGVSACYGSVAAGLASATVSVAKRGPSEPTLSDPADPDLLLDS